MAYYDPRIQAPFRNNKNCMTVDRSGQETQINNFSSAKERLTKIDIYQQDVETDSIDVKILSDLDFEKVVVKREFA